MRTEGFRQSNHAQKLNSSLLPKDILLGEMMFILYKHLIIPSDYHSYQTTITIQFKASTIQSAAATAKQHTV